MKAKVNACDNQTHKDVVNGDKVMGDKYQFAQDKRNFAPFVEEPLFDRINLDKELARKLSSTYCPIYIISPEGLGKTFFLKKFCMDKFVSDYNRVYWIESEKDDVREDIIKSIPDYQQEPSLSTEENWRRLISQFQGRNVLLVIINMHTENAIINAEKYIPELKWRVVITTNVVDVELPVWHNIIDDGIDENCDNERAIIVKPFPDEDCIKFFLFMYCKPYEKNRYRINNIDSIKTIVSNLQFNTGLIKIAARLEPKPTIEKLLSVTNAMSDSDMLSKFVSMLNSVSFSSDQIKTMYVMSWFPSSSLSETILDDWMREIAPASACAYSLSIMGWLERNCDKNTGIQSYYMTSMVKQAMKMFDKECPDFAEKLFNNMSAFYYTPVFGEGELDAHSRDKAGTADFCVRFLEHFDSLCMERYRFSESLFLLKKNYYYFLLKSELNPSVYDYIKTLRSEFDQYIFNSSLNPDDELLDIDDMADTAAVRYSKDNDRYIKRQTSCAAMLSFAEAHCSHASYRYYRAVRKNIRANGYSQYIPQTITDLTTLSDQIATQINSDHPNDDIEMKYIRFECLRAILDYYDRLLLKEGDKEKRKQLVESAFHIYNTLKKDRELWLNTSDEYITQINNALGVYLIHHYDIFKIEADLDEAKDLFDSSYDSRVKKYTKDSLIASRALAKLAMIACRQQEFDQAAQMLKDVIYTSVKIYKDNNFKFVWKTYWDLANVYYKKYLQFENEYDLKLAKDEISKAISICKTIHDETQEKYHTEYQALLQDQQLMFKESNYEK
jgi:hypothetical protein